MKYEIEMSDKWKPGECLDCHVNCGEDGACPLSNANPIDPDYAEFKAWKESAAQMSRNAEYYRGLVVKIGDMFGEAAYISDDGSKQQDVLCAKVPELVSAALAPKPEAKTYMYGENKSTAKPTPYTEQAKTDGLMKWVDLNIKKYGEGNSTFEGGAMQVLNTLKWNILNGSFSHPATLEPLALKELARSKGLYICKLTDIFISKDPSDKKPEHFISEVQARKWLEEQKEGEV